MALLQNNVISPKIAPPGAPATVHAQPVHFGRLLADELGGELEVIWDNTVQNNVGATDLATLALSIDRIGPPDAAELARLGGRWVRHTLPGGPTALDPSGGTSRSFDGLVVGVYRRTSPENALDDGPTYCQILTNSGLYFEDVSTSFVVDTNR